MDWNGYLDLYCERLIPGFWGEPLNAVSNAAFWIAAWVVWRRWRTHMGTSGFSASSYRQSRSHWDIHTLLIMLVLIGAGSFAFHTFATRWASVVDVLCIALYLHFYLAVHAHRSLGLGWRWAWLGVPVFALLSQAALQAWGLMATAITTDTGLWSTAHFMASPYLAAWTVLLLIVVHSAWRRLPSFKPLAMAAILFAASLTLRQLDMPLCSGWRLGTHFAWHMLNAVTLGLTTWAAVNLATPALNPRMV